MIRLCKKNLFAGVFIFVIFLYPPIAFSKISILAKEGKGLLLSINGQKLVLLQGTPYEIGFQHGKPLRKEVKKLVETILIIADSTKPGILEEAWERTKKFIPERYLQELEGLSAGSGIPLRKIQLVNSFPEISHCSGIYLTGKTTEKGQTYHVRILDYITEAFIQDFSVVMLIRNNKYNTIMTAGFAGFTGCVTDMNDKRICIGEMGGAGYGNYDGIPMVFLMRKALEEARDLQEAIEIFKKGPRTCEYYYLITDGKIPDSRGLYCTHDKFEIFTPGQKELPEGFEFFPEDTILMTGSDRYRILRERIVENYGKINLEKLIEIIKRPVSMSGNLHNAIFLPEEMKMFLAVAKRAYEKDFQACYQVYNEFDLKFLMGYFPEKTARIKKIKPFELAIPVPPEKKRQFVIKEDKLRRFDYLSSNFPEFFKIFKPQEKDLPVSIEFNRRTTDYDVFDISFPSPVELKFPINTAYCEYYKSFHNSGKECVILLDALFGNLTVTRVIAAHLAINGIDACVVDLPVYGSQKRKIDRREISPEIIPRVIIQALNDIRVAASVINEIEKNDVDIYLCGVSYGALIAALFAEIDGSTGKLCLVLGGGDLNRIMVGNKNFSGSLPKDISGKIIEIALKPFDPITYTDGLQGTKVLMINAKYDEIIPEESVISLYEKLRDKEIIWYQTTHYGIANYLPEILEHIANFMKGVKIGQTHGTGN